MANPDLIVKKSNLLIQKSRFSLSLQEQKLILFIISKIKPQDREFQEYSFTVKEFCELCNIDYTSGKNYGDIKTAIKTLADKSVWVNIDGADVLLRWVEKAKIKDNIISIRIDNDLKPYLLELNKNFTMYELFWTLHFKSKYSIRLYELIKSIHFDNSRPYTRIFKFEELRDLLGAENYDYSNFKLRVLDVAVKEVSDLSDEYVEYRVVKRNKRKVEEIELFIETFPTPKKLLKRYRKLK